MSGIEEYLARVPEDDSDEKWSIAAAAFIGTLAHSPDIEVSDEVRFSTLVLYARMPRGLEDKAKEYIDDQIAKYIEKTPEFQEGKADIHEFLDQVEKGIDPEAE